MEILLVLTLWVGGALVPQQAGLQVPARPTITPDGAETLHLALRTSASRDLVKPGGRLSLFVDVEPKPGMHVYSPEQKNLIPISLTLEPVDGLRPHPPKLPPAEKYFFAPLEETHLVYSRPFRLEQDVTIARTPSMRARAQAGDTLTIRGTLRYQACDDAICYLPVTIPLKWEVRLGT